MKNIEKMISMIDFFVWFSS